MVYPHVFRMFSLVWWIYLSKLIQRVDIPLLVSHAQPRTSGHSEVPCSLRSYLQSLLLNSLGRSLREGPWHR